MTFRCPTSEPGWGSSASQGSEQRGFAAWPARHHVKLKARLFALAELSHRRETVVGPEAALVERDRSASAQARYASGWMVWVAKASTWLGASP